MAPLQIRAFNGDCSSRSYVRYSIDGSLYLAGTSRTRRLCMCILPWGKWMYLAASDVEILRHLSE